MGFGIPRSQCHATKMSTSLKFYFCYLLHSLPKVAGFNDCPNVADFTDNFKMSKVLSLNIQSSGGPRVTM